MKFLNPPNIVMMKIPYTQPANFICVLFSFVFILFFSFDINAQLMGNKNIPGDYATIAAAVTDLNMQGVGAGGVTFNVVAGHTESSGAQITLTATGTMANPIIFQKSGVGANPLISRTDAGANATSIFGGLGDAVFQMTGSDYVTIDAIDVSASDMGIEYGYFTSKPSATDGCQFVTISNCVVTMTKGTSAYVTGIYISNGPTSVSTVTGVTVSANSGRNENVTLNGNTISNVHAGIHVRGSSAATFADQNVIVGQSGAGNTIQNFGGGSATATYGVYLIYQVNPTITYNTIDNAGGGGSAHASTLYGVYFFTSVTGDIVASDNSITLNTSGTLAVQWIYNANTASSINISSNIFSGTIAATSTSYIIYNSSSTVGTITIADNVTSGTVSKTGASGTFYGYYNFGSPGSGVENISNNDFSNITLSGTSVFNGIYSQTAAGHTHNIFNNTISNITGTHTGATTGINVTSANTRNIYGNTIFNISTGGAVTGIANGSGGATELNIYKNKIYDLNTNSTLTTAALVSGITVSSGTTNSVAKIYNNLIGNLTAPTAAGTDAIRGVNITSAISNTSIALSFNTIYLAASSSGTNFGTSGIFHTTSATATTATLDLRNNIIVNLSTASGTGLTAAYRRSSTTLTNYGSVSNNNLFYAGTPSATNLIFTDGTNSDQNIADYKTRVTPRDAASVSENPPFLSTTGSSANFLHIDPAIATQVESGAGAIGGITDDYDGQVRNVTTPDIGADEGMFTLADLTGPVIAYTTLGNSCNTSAVTLSATITDASGVPTMGIGLPVLYWKINAGAYTAATGVFISGNTYQFTFGSGAMVTDVISYYIVAQDNVGTPNVSASPSAGASGYSANPPAVSTPPTTPNTYTILATLSGTYTVGAGGDYATLTAAVADYNAKCISGAVIFSLTDASYSGSETFPIVLNLNPASSSMNTLTIRPAMGVAAVISGTGGASATALIRLNGAKYVTIDGVNTGGASLTIENTSTTSGSAVVWLSSNGAGLGASNNTIQNCSIKAGVTQNTTTTNTYGIVIAGATLSGTFTSIAPGNDNDNNTISGNTITKCRYAIHTRGGATSNPNLGTIISNNIIGPASFGTESLGKGGIVSREEDGMQITGNEIRFVGGNYANIPSTVTDRAAIMFGTDVIWPPTSVFVKNALISKNIIHDIVDERTNSAVGIGIGAVDGSNATNNLVVNNMIYNILSNGVSDQGIGIGLSAGNGDKVVYNTIFMTGDTDPDGLASTPTTSNFGISVASVDVTNPAIKDNIVFMDLTSSSAPSLQNACINVPSSFVWGTGSSNYNDFYAAPANTQANVGCVGGSGGTFHLSLAAWQGAVTQDANSISVQPVFTSGTNLHLVPSSNAALNDFGTPIAGITTDIDMDVRNVTMPDMGADEFTPPAGVDVGIIDLVSPAASGCYTSTEMVTVTLKNFSVSTIDFSVNNVMVTVTATGGYSSNITLNSGTLASNATQNVTVPATIDLTMNGTYTFNSNTTLAGDITPGNDAMTPVNRVVFSIGGTYPVGTGQSGSGGFETITAAVAAYNSASCFTGAVIFELYDATYTTPGETLPISINGNMAAGVNTLTIRPETGVSSEITGSASAILKLNGADYVIIDGSNNATTSRNLTISNTSTASNSAAIWVASLGTTSGASNNTIKNTIVKAGSNTVTSTFGIYIGGTGISTSGTGDDNDNLTLQNNSISKAYYGIYAQAASTGVNNNLMITNNSIGSFTAADYVTFRGLLVSQATGATVSQNTVFNLIHSATNIRAMEFGAGFVNSVISRNVITEIMYTSTSFSAGKGITLASGTATADVTVSNNAISALKGHGSSTATNNTWAIMMTDGGGYNIYYNSISIPDNRSSTGSADLHGGIYIASAVTALNIKDNSISVTGNPGNASGRMYGIYSLAASPFTSSNYNDLFVSGTQHSVGYFTSANQNTLTDWMTASAQDANSISVDPAYNTGVNLVPLPGSPLVGAGTMITGITIDLPGATRDVTAPTIGAYEQVGDATGPAISYSLFPTTLCTSGLNLTATISDLSGINSTLGTRPRLYYKKSTDANTYAGNSSANNGWKYVEAGNTSSPFGFTMDFSLLQSPATGGDVIQYFVIAQDMAPTPNVGIHSGVFAATPSSVALTSGAFPIGGTINSYMIVGGGLSMNVTIGAAGTYTSLTGVGGLFEAINASGLLSNITATILDATVAETGATPLNDIRYGCGGPFSLTIKPGAAVTTVLSGASTTPLIDLSGADLITFDGSNNGTNTKDMTIRNTSTSAGAIRFINDATSNTLMNTIIEGANTSTTNGVVLFSTSATGSAGNSNNILSNCSVRDRSDATGVPANAIYSSGTAGVLNATNTITGCELFNFNSSGINLASTGIGNNWQINNNNIYNAQGTPSAVTQNGLIIAGGTGHLVSGNSVGGNSPGASGLWTNTGNVIVTGISITGGLATIQNNTVANITTTNTGTTARTRGIANTSGGADGVVINNNTIFNLSSFGAIASYAGGSQPVIGIHVFPGTTWYISNITNNLIHDLSAENTSALTTSNMAVGIVLTNWRGECSNNKIYNIRNKSTGTTAGQPPIVTGIYARFMSTGVVYNNTISLGDGESNNVQYNGIQVVGAGDVGNLQYYYFNSVRITGTGTGTFSSHGFLRGDNSTTSPSHPVTIKNNIFSMERSGGGAVNYAIASQGTNPGNVWESNYNVLYNTSATDIGFWDATGYNFANWQSTTAQDANSVSVAPVFAGITDLHLTPANAMIDNAGTPIAGIELDIDLQARNFITPDPGVDEINLGCSTTVTNNNDSGAGSLRDVIACAVDGETILFDGSLTGQTITLTTGEIVINKNLALAGLGKLNLTLSGNNASRIFHVQTGNSFRIKDMSLINASAMSNGGALFVEGSLRLENTLLENNFENGVPKSLTIVMPALLEVRGAVEMNE